MLPRISGVHISNFRGIRELQIHTHRGECLLIIGDNGTGKSSVIDAIEFFFNKEIGKFTGREDVNLNDCIPFTGADPRSCYVDFVFENIPTPSRAKFLPAKTMKDAVRWENIPESIGPGLDAASKRSFILHRAQLTTFIESRPAQRFQSISELIGIEFLDKTVDAWKKERNERERKKEDAEKNYDNLTREFSTLLDCPIKTEADIVHAINARIAHFRIGRIHNPEEIEGKNTYLASKSSNFQNQSEANRYRAYTEGVNQIVFGWNSFLDKYNLLFIAWRSFLEKANLISDAEFEIVIKEGRRLIVEKGLENCPVCEQPLDRLPVIRRLSEREQALLALSESRSILDAKRRDAQNELLKCLSHLQSLPPASKDLKLSLPDRLEESWEVLETINNCLNRSPLLLEPPDHWKNHPVLHRLIHQLTSSQANAANEISSFTPSARDREISETAFILGKVSEKWVGWRNALLVLERSGKVFEAVDQVYSCLIEARKKGIGEIVKDLEDDFIRLYEKLHPGEGHKAIKIILPENRDASADLRTETDGMKPMHPLGNYSEGHLDSLGLCIFLAFIKRFNTDFPLIVLDDVLTSIDAGHRMKVAQLISSEFKGNQLIITTHDEMWANELATVIRREQVPVKTIRMNPWSKENGATCDDFIVSNWDYYKQQIAQGRKQDAIGGAGRTLEQFLSRMRRHLHLAVPATSDDRYTLGPLLPAFWKWISDHEISRDDFDGFPQRLKVLNEEFDVYWNFRNWSGAHYNEWGATVSSEEAATFVSIVEELVTCFQCPACSSLVVYHSTQRLLHCPFCNSAPAPRIIWGYRPDWRSGAERLMVNMQYQSKLRRDFLQLSQSTLENVLKDSRRRFRLSVPSTIDDRYTVADLFQPFFDHLGAYPCSDDLDWGDRLANIQTRLCEFLTPEFGWRPAEDLLARGEELYQIVGSLTGMITCPTCQSLFTFTPRANAYTCQKCNADSVHPVPAAWFVHDRKAARIQ